MRSLAAVEVTEDGHVPGVAPALAAACGAWNRLISRLDRSDPRLSEPSAAHDSTWPTGKGARSRPGEVGAAVLARVGVLSAETALPGACAMAEDATRQAAAIRGEAHRLLHC